MVFLQKMKRRFILVNQEKNKSPNALAARGFQPKPYHNAGKRCRLNNGTKISKISFKWMIIAAAGKFPCRFFALFSDQAYDPAGRPHIRRPAHHKDSLSFAGRSKWQPGVLPVPG